MSMPEICAIVEKSGTSAAGCLWVSAKSETRVYYVKFQTSKRETTLIGSEGHTGSSDSEGTLGGLVQVGRRVHETVKAALDLGTLCSNDPVCPQHDPASRHESRFLHGAACHGCLLISETCCEQQNEFLDRALVIPTVQNVNAEFFTGILKTEGATAFANAD